MNQTDYLFSPSVHLTFRSDQPHSGSFNWLYEEECIPKGMDPFHTFYMAIGFNRGTSECRQTRRANEGYCFLFGTVRMLKG